MVSVPTVALTTGRNQYEYKKNPNHHHDYLQVLPGVTGRAETAEI